MKGQNCADVEFEDSDDDSPIKAYKHTRTTDSQRTEQSCSKPHPAQSSQQQRRDGSVLVPQESEGN